MDIDFNNWNKLKKHLNAEETIRNFTVRDVWWCHLGANMGDEENGKGEKFLRPVLIYKKFNKKIFLAIPLSSKIKENYYYHSFYFQEKQQSALISQICLLDSKRLFKKMGRVSEAQFNILRTKLLEVLS